MTNPTEAPMANAIDDVKGRAADASAAELVAWRPSYDQIIDLVENCRVRRDKAGESSRMMSKWISEGLNALYASPAPSQHTGWSDEAVEAAKIPVGDMLNRQGMIHLKRPASEAFLDQLVRAALTAASSIAPATGFEVKAQTYPKLRHVRAHKPSCTNVQVGSTYADKCDCGALDTAGEPIDISPSVAKESGEP